MCHVRCNSASSKLENRHTDFAKTSVLMQSLADTSSTVCILFLPAHTVSFIFDFEFTTHLMKAHTCAQNCQVVYFLNVFPVFSSKGLFGLYI